MRIRLHSNGNAHECEYVNLCQLLIMAHLMWSYLSASSISHGKFVAAKTMTVFFSPSSLTVLLLTPSTWTSSSDLTRREDSCSPEALGLEIQ